MLLTVRTIILHTLPVHDGGYHVSYQSWMLGTLVPLWVGARVAVRTWSTAWNWGRRRRH
jgi:hypothetical protein